MNLDPLLALSPLDGRYARALAPLRAFGTEAALISERIRVEALWLLWLEQHSEVLPGARLTPAVRVLLQALAAAPPAEAAAAVKEIERGINHDVKAVEYYLRQQLAAAGATPAQLELVHFGCTSEDINNLCYARLLRQARGELMLPTVRQLIATLHGMATEHAALPMMARTHGQCASPTTLGKEFANVVTRLQRTAQRWQSVAILAKWNGAVGNFNAHHAALPGLDWPAIARQFVASQQLEYNAWTTQIEPHDWIAEYCDACAALNVILIDLCRDVWGYISLGYLRQRLQEGEVGSSTMPHKVNPIDFENAEGNLGVANALLRHFSDKLPLSRWQRDLTDSTVLRNLGVALGHSLLAWQSLQRGLGKLSPDGARMSRDLDESWELLGEAVQTVLRVAGVANGYEQLKAFTRGQQIDAAMLRQFIEQLPLPEAEKQRLKTLTPRAYLGLAQKLALQTPEDGT